MRGPLFIVKDHGTQRQLRTTDGERDRTARIERRHMLTSLQVTNYALIDHLEVNFSDGLNILTGETGAGKSILLGSIQAALGAKTTRDFIRTGAETAFVELVFEDRREEVKRFLEEKQLSAEDGSIILSRRITAAGKSVSRINGEVVTASVAREMASVLMEIHGQQEYHTLTDCEKQLAVLDRYAKDAVAPLLETVREDYSLYTRTKRELEQAQKDGIDKTRDISYLEFAQKEISDAAPKTGEDEELESRFKRLSNAKMFSEGVLCAQNAICGNSENADEYVQTALRSLAKIAGLDDGAAALYSKAEEIAALISDFSEEASNYLSEFEDFEEEYSEISDRLSLLNHLKAKYGKTVEEVLAYAAECGEKLERYADYDAYLDKLTKAFEKAEERLKKTCAALREIRKKAARELEKNIIVALSELNFLEVRFEIRFSEGAYSENGFDKTEFFIATNPGEAIRPLGLVASGGELSRVMLAIKSVLADKDEIPTLLFDEIDTGISGRTAQMVSEKLAQIAGKRQLICITHLPQIASMADRHFYIEKTTDGKTTVTGITPLNEKESVAELSRMLGGAGITDAVLKNAEEMRRLADEKKYNLRNENALQKAPNMV